MELDVVSVSGAVVQISIAGALLKILLKRDEDDRTERKDREHADRQERRERLQADQAMTVALTAQTEVLRGLADAVERVGAR